MRAREKRNIRDFKSRKKDKIRDLKPNQPSQREGKLEKGGIFRPWGETQRTRRVKRDLKQKEKPGALEKLRQRT